jgi:hypothetical protein
MGKDGRWGAFRNGIKTILGIAGLAQRATLALMI